MKLKESHGDGLYSDVGIIMLLDKLESLFANLGNLFEELYLVGIVVNTNLGVDGFLSFKVLEVHNLAELGEVVAEFLPICAVRVREVILEKLLIGEARVEEGACIGIEREAVREE